MSITGVGPALDLDGPLPRVRRHSLLETDGVRTESPGDRWLNGVNVYGYPEGTPKLWEPCAVGTFRVKDEGSEIATPRFDPVAIYFPLQCSRIGTGDFSAFAARAEEALDATLSHGVEQALASGAVLSNNPFLGDTNLTVLSGAAQSPAVGLRMLDNAIGELTGRQGMIHATPAVVDAWGAGGGLRDIDDLVTTAGTPVVSGSGYIGVDPVNEPSPTDTVDWVFATGFVEVRVREGVDISEGESLDRSDNTVVVRAERFVLVEWDTSLQVGVRIDWTQSP